ncbi:MAG: nucleotide sugar dehydrogenase [Candidatus Sericytochromatia bacterium]|nr:nucleotide sugar dehydrogenase [Candidatus Sericytochromatia bacterium]
MNEKVAVIGLGYVGLPVALAFARQFPDTVGFDVNTAKVAELRAGLDRTGEVAAEVLRASTLKITDHPAELAGTTFFVVAVPTPIMDNRQPDLRALRAASATVGKALQPGAVVVYESTVYPGLTEEVCGPILAEVSGLRCGIDFTLGYSPERINPGDKEHTLERIVKVVSGQDAPTLDRVAAAYGAIVPAGVFRASSIAVAEAAKVIENTQRDLNIALMNELALIFDRLGIPTRDVLAAAGTKWNFLPFTPGLVGGHCIGVDPYYLTARAEATGYHPQVILAGRRINDGMGAFIAQRLVKMLIHADRAIKGARVGVLGLTFKENVPDIRNSRVPDILAELQQYGITPLLHDPLAEADEVRHEYGLTLSPQEAFQDLDALVLAVPHRAYREQAAALLAGVRPGGVVVDVKSMLAADTVPASLTYWSL